MTPAAERIMKFGQSATLANGVLWLALILLSWFAAALLWLLWKGPSVPLPAPAAVQAAPLPVMPNPLAIALMFGEQPQADASQPSTETTLNVRLLGILYSSDADAARANIVERTGGQAKWFKSGDEVVAGATLVRVEADHVALLRNGREELLRFDKPNESMLNAPPAQPTAATDAAGNQRQALRDISERLKNSPILALRQMGMRRTTRGYIVSHSAPAEMLKRLSLAPGDRIISINGQAVGQDLDNDVKVMSQLQDNTSARVEVQRGTQTLTLEQRL